MNIRSLEDMPRALRIFLATFFSFVAIAVIAAACVLARFGVPMLLTFDKEAMGFFFGSILTVPAIFFAYVGKELILQVRRILRTL